MQYVKTGAIAAAHLFQTLYTFYQCCDEGARPGIRQEIITPRQTRDPERQICPANKLYPGQMPR